MWYNTTISGVDFMLNEDIAYAQKLISGNKCMEFDKIFHDK